MAKDKRRRHVNEKQLCMTGQTKNDNGQWWQEVLQSLPEVLGGVAQVVDASNGNSKPPVSTTPTPSAQAPSPSAKSKSFPWVWVIVGVLILGVGAMIYIAKTKKA